MVWMDRTDGTVFARIFAFGAGALELYATNATGVVAFFGEVPFPFCDSRVGCVGDLHGGGSDSDGLPQVVRVMKALLIWLLASREHFRLMSRRCFRVFIATPDPDRREVGHVVGQASRYQTFFLGSGGRSYPCRISNGTESSDSTP